MKYDEFAFFNQQLAAMLRDGIPLEGALKRLCEEMHTGNLRDEMQAFEGDLARGTPIAEALKPRQLPDLYKRMVLVGVKSGDLPGALTMLADYFQRQNDIWTRLKSMMTYPLIVMFGGFIISLLIAVLWNFIVGPAFRDLYNGMGMRLPGATLFALGSLQAIWTFPLVLGILFLLALFIIFQPAMRGRVLWGLPAFKEANVARVASALTLLLENGVSLPDAIGLVQGLEDNKRATADLQRWKEKLAAGAAKFSEIASASRVFPPMFIWTVAGAGEDLTSGFRRAADMYQSRAIYRTEVALFSVLPVASLFLGAIVMSQAFLVFSMFLPMITMIDNLS